MSKYTSAVILSAGIGSRFGGDTKKQYIPVSGTPCIVHTVRALENCSLINEIILVGDETEIKPIIEKYSFSKISRIVPGGETRQESALLGFDFVNPKSEYVAIHDAARCLVTSDMISETVKTAYKYRAAAAAHKSEDTVKSCGKDGVVESTLDRDKIWLVQTPQVFSADVYRVAAYMAKKDGAMVTDDCAMCERLGFKVKMVECGRSNIKLTSREDLTLAEAILTARKEDRK